LPPLILSNEEAHMLADGVTGLIKAFSKTATATAS